MSTSIHWPPLKHDSFLPIGIKATDDLVLGLNKSSVPTPGESLVLTDPGDGSKSDTSAFILGQPAGGQAAGQIQMLVGSDSDQPLCVSGRPLDRDPTHITLNLEVCNGDDEMQSWFVFSGIGAILNKFGYCITVTGDSSALGAPVRSSGCGGRLPR